MSRGTTDYARHWRDITEAPEDYGRHHARCERCGAWLCRYHDPAADGGLCWPCAPGGEGVVLRIAEGRWMRYTAADLRRRGYGQLPVRPEAERDQDEDERLDELAELMTA